MTNGNLRLAALTALAGLAAGVALGLRQVPDPPCGLPAPVRLQHAGPPDPPELRPDRIVAC